MQQSEPTNTYFNSAKALKLQALTSQVNDHQMLKFWMDILLSILERQSETIDLQRKQISELTGLPPTQPVYPADSFEELANKYQIPLPDRDRKIA